MIGVIGLGYVGGPTAYQFESAGFDVVRHDLDPARGDTNPACLAGADAVVICVPTPTRYRRPVYGPVEAALRAIRAHAPDSLAVMSSTVGVGDTRRLTDGLRAAMVPERISPGQREGVTTRIVGGTSDEAGDEAERLFTAGGWPVHRVASAEVAEAAKLLENAFRAVNLAFANEWADGCVALGLDPLDVLTAAATKPYGFLPVRPGIGVGGHCIPVDPYYMPGWERMPVLRRAMIDNRHRPWKVAERIAAAVGEATVRLVGRSYKPETDDERNSPALAVRRHLTRLGVDWSDRYGDQTVLLHPSDEDGLDFVNGYWRQA